ncbi:MAG: thiolase family protein [Alphaproteobacteria bacterium]
MAWITGVEETRFGQLDGEDTLSLMTDAAAGALADAGLARADIDGVLCSYSTALPHTMLATVFAEHFGLSPTYCHSVAVGGASGAAMVMLAKILVESGRCRHVLAVAGENRLTGVGKDGTVKGLAQVGHPDFEVPFGPTVPAYYGLVASRYMHEYGTTEEDLAAIAVLLRDHAARNPKAHFRDPITVADVMTSRVIAAPLKLLDCCRISDGAVALLISREPLDGASVRIAGAAQGHTHQHVSAAPTLVSFGGGEAAKRAMAEAGITARAVDIAGIYDPFTIALLIFLEEIGFCGRGEAGNAVRSGHFSFDGTLPLNTHGGLISFGHSGVAGGMAHIAEVYRQLAIKAGSRQIGDRTIGFVHNEGGVLSANVSLVLIRN